MAAASSPFTAVTAMGALIAPAQFAKIAAASLPGQDADSYGVPRGLTLRDELARFFRIGQAQWRAFSAVPMPGAGVTARFIEGLFKDVLGFADIVRLSDPVTVGERSFPVALRAGAVPIAVAPAADAIDRPSDALSAQSRRRSAATLMQEFLNAEPTALWGLATNGRCIRLVRDNPSLTRPAFIEFDLAAIFDDEAYADFATLFLTLHRSRFAANDETCPLEVWRLDGAKAGAVARDKLRDGVEAALLLLGQGFLENPANTMLAERLRSGALSLEDYYAALLRLVYRLIFLLAAEDRGLLHPADAPVGARQLYARGYALGRLRDRSVRRAAWDRHHDAWEGLCIVMRALGRGEPRLGLPALGGLFDRDSLPDIEGATLANSRLLEAIYRLAWLREQSGPTPVNLRDMESEELGSVYEGLLELVPRLERGGTEFAFATEGVETKGNARKISGSYYTPDSLVQALLDSALNPLLEATVRAAEDPVAALLALRVVDPACGSGHFLLAAARRIAARLAAERIGGSPAPDDYRRALREVMGACIHGVDRNPMAVELTKVALWIESLEPGKPLGLLDANIRCGDALLGLDDLTLLHAGIPDAAYAPLTGDDKEAAKALRALNKAERERPLLSLAFRPARLATEAARVRDLPEETLAQVEAKRQAYGAMAQSAEGTNLRRAADAWVGAFLAPKLPGGIVATTRDVWESVGGVSAQSLVAGEVDRLARLARVFHWPLEFPAVLAREDPGFDLVIGNPPWEVMELSEEEYFAARIPEIAAMTGAARKRAILGLAEYAPQEFANYQTAKRNFDASNAFVRKIGRFHLTARGKLNTYSLFAETFSRLTGSRGRAGIIVPAGLTTDYNSAAFFRELVDRRRMISSFAFDNQKRIFPAVHPDTPFTILTIGETDADPKFTAYLLEIEDLAQPERHYELSAAEIAAINPNTRTAPTFRTAADAELTAAIYSRVPVLIDEAAGRIGNPWDVQFRQGLFNMTSDSGLFRTWAELTAKGLAQADAVWTTSDGALYVPLYEAKMIHQLDHRWATYAPGTSSAADTEGSREATRAEKADPDFEPTPRYWIAADEVRARLDAFEWSRGWLMGWRNVTNATNERTVIASFFPTVAVGHSMPLVNARAATTELWTAFLGNWLSLTFDFVARQKLAGVNLTYTYLKQFPVLAPSTYGPSDLEFIVPRVLELTYTSHAMASFARDLGFSGPPFAWDEARRANLRAELDAWYARAYGLSRDQLRYILDPADVMGTDYPTETFRVLKKNDIARFGDYRTARLTLAAWDAQAQET